MTFDEAQVGEIFKRQFARVKPMLVKGRIEKLAACEVEPWSGFIASQKARANIEPHVSEGAFPERLFLSRAPNQTEEELKWMRDNFEQVTLPVYLDLENTVGRGMHETNWSLEVKDEEVSAHLNGGIREWGALFSFIKAALLKRKISDPMGVVAFLPSSIDTSVDGDGNETMAPDAKLLAEPFVFGSDRVWGFEYDSWYLLRLTENSELREGSKKVREGVVCILIDDTSVWRIEQYGRDRDESFKISLDYEHRVGEAPAIHMMGTPSAQNDGLVWTSPFSASAGLLNVALLTEHQLRASETKLMFPVRVMIGDPCDFYDQQHGVRCMDGEISWRDGEKLYTKKCPSCSGMGHKNRISPFGELVINADPNSTKPDAVTAATALSYASPSTDTSRFMREEVNAYITAARSVMHLDAETPMTGGQQQSATQAGLNAKARAAFVKPICDQLFVIFEFGVRCTGKMIRGSDWTEYALRIPVEYDLRTDADFIATIAEAAKSDLPVFIRSMLVNEFISSRHADDAEALSNTRALAIADRMAMMSEAAVAAEIASGRAQPWETLLHYSGEALLRRAAVGEGFGALDEIAKAEALQELANELASADAPMSGILGRIANAVK